VRVNCRRKPPLFMEKPFFSFSKTAGGGGGGGNVLQLEHSNPGDGLNGKTVSVCNLQAQT
jgi:hypothetical protein